jgi:hypothetical protein
MINTVAEFADLVGQGKVEIYNEFSLQHELGIFLRTKFPDQKVQFERNVSHFFPSVRFVKKEIDLCVYSADGLRLVRTIELKFPRNGQVPEQMFKFCQDIRFAEELKRAGFERTYFVVFADDPLFYGAGTRRDGIFAYFRNGQELSGSVNKPTKATNGMPPEITLDGSYQIRWFAVSGSLKYAVVEATNGPLAQDSSGSTPEHKSVPVR